LRLRVAQPHEGIKYCRHYAAVHAPVDSSGCFQASSRTFYSLARPDSGAAYRAPECSCHGLSETILNNAKPTREVIVDMISFFCSLTPQGHKAVLLAHNGNTSDFPHLLTTMQRNDIPLPAFIAFYGDTLAWAKLSPFKPGSLHALSLADLKLTTLCETILAKQRDHAHQASMTHWLFTPYWYMLLRLQLRLSLRLGCASLNPSSRG
jgi:hypothetical protein